MNWYAFGGVFFLVGVGIFLTLYTLALIFNERPKMVLPILGVLVICWITASACLGMLI